MSDGWGDGCGSRGTGGRCIRHAPAAPPRAVGPLAVPVIEPAFQAALMLGGRPPPLEALRDRTAAIPTVGLPTPAGPTEAKHRPAPRPAAPHRAPRHGSGHRPLHAAPAAPCEEATGQDGGDRPTGGRGRRRASRWAAITRTRIPTPSRSRERDTPGTCSCRCENLGARGRDRQPPGGPPPRAATPRVARAGAETAAAPRRPSAPARGAVARVAGAPAPAPVLALLVAAPALLVVLALLAVAAGPDLDRDQGRDLEETVEAMVRQLYAP